MADTEKKEKKRNCLYRTISTTTWKDSKFQDLNMQEKLLFLYALTNQQTNLMGVYEISKKQIIFDTGLSSDQLDKALKTLEKNNMLKYDNETKEIYIVNFLKHNIFNEKHEKGAMRFYDDIKSPNIKESITTYIQNNFDTISIPYAYPMHDRDKRKEIRDKSIELSDKSIELSDKSIELSDKGLEKREKEKEIRDKGLEEREKGKEKEFEKRKEKGVRTLSNIDLDVYAHELVMDINVIVKAYDELKNNNFISVNGEVINTKQDLINYFMSYEEEY